MVCNTVRELMDAYIDGCLEPDEASELAAHLESCSECRDLYNDSKDMIGLIGSLEEVELPDGFHERLLSRLNDEIAADLLCAEELPIPEAVCNLNGNEAKPECIGINDASGEGARAKFRMTWYKWCGAAVAVAALLLSIRLGDKMDLFSGSDGASPSIEAPMEAKMTDTGDDIALNQQETRAADDESGEQPVPEPEETEGTARMMLTALPESDSAGDEADGGMSEEPADSYEGELEFGIMSAPAGLTASNAASYEIIVYADPAEASHEVLLEWAGQYGIEVIGELEDGVIYNIIDGEQMELLLELLNGIGRVEGSRPTSDDGSGAEQVAVRIAADVQ